MHLLDPFLHSKNILFQFQHKYSIFLGVLILKILIVFCRVNAWNFAIFASPYDIVFGKEGEAFIKTETFIMIDNITSIQITRDLNDSDMAHMDIMPHCTRIFLKRKGFP